MAREKKTQKPQESLKSGALLERNKTLSERVVKLEELIEIISRGKYMWESTFDAITAPVEIVSQDFNIVRANLSLAAVAKKDIGGIIGRKCYEVFAERSDPCHGCPLQKAQERDAQTISGLGNHIREREFEVSAYPLKGTGKELTVLYYRDMTEERRLQREVIQQEKMAAIGMLAGGVAHEINNPLGGILAFTQIMKKDAKDNKMFLDDLEEVERAAIRCKKIVADLLDFSRVSKERERRGIDINVLLEKIFPFLQREMRALNVELIFDGAANLPPVFAIPDRLQQVFLNLMTNACHAMPKGGKLTVKTHKKKGDPYIEVKVIDTGIGICPTIREKIFDPFFTTKEPGKGTGLGLSISYRIIKEHNGEILCEEAHGGGTEFIVRLPIAEA